MPTRSHIHSRDGIALVMVLAFIVLLTILIVSFIAFTRLNRVSTASYSKSIQAQEVAQGGLEDILSDLHNEIIAGSTVYNTNSAGVTYTNSSATVYVPTTNLTAMPARIGYPNADYGSDTTPTTLSPTLIRVSRATDNANAVGGDTFFTSPPAYYSMTNVPGGAILDRASLASTSASSINGRSISAARWNKTYLLATNAVGVPAPFTTASPDWVYVTRTGSRVCTTAEVTAGSLKPSASLAANYGTVTPGVNPPASPVVGRYAFVMYDEGALLDANVAGYTHQSTNLVSSPADPTTGITQAVNGKSYLAYADLTQLPGLSGNQATVDNFVSWRNASAVSTGNTYLLALINYSKSGFLNFASGDSPLLGRQDLINYFASIDSHINTSSATYSKALPYLGTFSRAVSAPSWTPPVNSNNDPNYQSGLSASAPFAYKDNAEKTGSVNRDLANVRFATAGTVQHYGDNATVSPVPTYTVNVGDPLLQNRFSLAKIDWLSQADPVAGTAPTSTYATAIQACFGLVWGSPGSTTTNSNTSTCTANGGNPCWNYVGSPAGTGGTLAAFNGTIETLDQVALEAREPNFFELLKAAILSGSVGLGGGPAAFNNGGAPVLLPAQLGSQIPWYYEGYNPYQFRGGPGGLFSYTLVPADFANSTYKLNGGPHGPDQFPDVQIMKIGANIIDQYDADSFPTAIYFPYGDYTQPVTGITFHGVNASSALGNSLDPAKTAGSISSGANAMLGPVSMVYGDENLPLLHRIYAVVASPGRQTTNPPGDPTDIDVHTMESWYQPQLWNPHQQPTTALTGANVPVNFEIRAYGAAQTYCSEAGGILLDPSKAPAVWPLYGWSPGTANPPDPSLNLQTSSISKFYPGVTSTETPSGNQAGTLVFSIDPTQFPFCDTPRLLTIDSIPGVTVNQTSAYSLTVPSSSPTPSAVAASSFPASYFPGWNTKEAFGNPSYPNGFSNDFAAFSAGAIADKVAAAPFEGSYVPTNTGGWPVAPVPVVSTTSRAPAVSFALGWYPATGSPADFHPYSFITGIFEIGQVNLSISASNPNVEVGYVQTNGTGLFGIDWGSVDPRTSRFSNTFGTWNAEIGFESENNTLGSWNSTGESHSTSGLPITGNFVTQVAGAASEWGQAYASFPQGWMTNTTSPLLAAATPLHGIPTWAPANGGVAMNTPSTSAPTPTPYAAPNNTPAYYADPDGVVRPGDGAYANASTGDGIMTFTTPGTPTGTATSTTDQAAPPIQHGRRPIILNRPFRSVGELGYVFRDEPFKTLDFFSKSSADAALLDVFSLTDESTIANGQVGSVVAGQFNPSNAPVPVIQAVLAGGSKKDTVATYNIGTEAGTIAQNCVTALNPAGSANPVMNRAALATQLMPALLSAMTSANFNSGDMANKTYFEAPVRALADVTNTRTWNLLIDIIAQSGQMSPTAASLNDFVVQGERRYWLHIAIDRYTGKIVDQQLEPVYE